MNNIERFEQLLRSTNRDGIEDLIRYIRLTNFYTAPASTKYHSNYDGGLLQHSLNVHDSLVELLNSPDWADLRAKISDDEIIISTLLHDFCKADYYKKVFKSVKVYCEDGNREDPGGKFKWVVQEGYEVDDKIPFGHGEKSVMMATEFINLTANEKYAIRWHMGFTEPKESYNTLNLAIAKYNLVLALHIADLTATYMKEA